MEKEIQQGVEEIKLSLEKAKSLYAWKKLKDSEQKWGHFTAFKMSDNTEMDMRMEVSYFTSKIVDLRRCINSKEEQWAITALNTVAVMEREMAIISPHV